MLPLVRKGVALQNLVPADMTVIEGDSDRIAQCLVNMVLMPDPRSPFDVG